MSHLVTPLLQAVNYYEAALKNSTEAQPHLRIELAELYLKLQQFDKADRTVRAGLSESREAGEDLPHLMDVTRYWQLLARVHQQGGRETAKIATALESARDNQARCADGGLSKEACKIQETVQCWYCILQSVICLIDTASHRG